MTSVDLSSNGEINYVFHRQLSKQLQQRDKHIQGFYPLVVTIQTRQTSMNPRMSLCFIQMVCMF